MCAGSGLIIRRRSGKLECLVFLAFDGAEVKSPVGMMSQVAAEVRRVDKPARVFIVARDARDPVNPITSTLVDDQSVSAAIDD